MTNLPADGMTWLAAHGVVDGRWVDGLRVDVDCQGVVVRAGAADTMLEPACVVARDLGPTIVVPGMVNAHSHAFQRAIRGATHVRRPSDPSNFWSWREAMYAAANQLEPDDLHAITRRAFAEMLHAGITCVGEFHYLHHQPGGQPYDDPNELSWQVVRAAEDAGIRLVLLEVYYARAGAGRAPAPEQRRFCDGSVDAYLRRVEALRDRGIHVGIAPHSVRAVSKDELRVLVEYAHAHDLPLHIHLSEQPRENEECMAEHGLTPTRLMAEVGGVDRPRGLTAVHAIHVDEDDRRLLGTQSVCACPTTEADLGDGIVRASELHATGSNLALGSDSNAVIDLVQEARLLEMHERLRLGLRLPLCDAQGRLWPVLLHAATAGGATSLATANLGEIAVGHPFDAVCIALDHPSLTDVHPEHVLDALFASGTAAPVRHVLVQGTVRPRDSPC
jgi:formimidoylglutamate deiminase